VRRVEQARLAAPAANAGPTAPTALMPQPVWPNQQTDSTQRWVCSLVGSLDLSQTANSREAALESLANNRTCIRVQPKKRVHLASNPRQWYLDSPVAEAAKTKASVTV